MSIEKHKTGAKIVKYQILDGPAPIVVDNIPMDPNGEYFPFEGYGTVAEQYSNAGGLKRMFKSIRARRNLKAQARASKIQAKGQAKVIKANAKQTKANAGLAGAKAQQIAAKGLSTADSTTVNNTAPSKSHGGGDKQGMSTGVKVAIGVGVVVVLSVVGFVVYKKMKKHKK